MSWLSPSKIVRSSESFLKVHPGMDRDPVIELLVDELHEIILFSVVRLVNWFRQFEHTMQEEIIS